MYEQLKDILINELMIDPDQITPEAELSSDLGINSIESTQLIGLCEEKFNITIDDSYMNKLVTVGDVVKCLEELTK